MEEITIVVSGRKDYEISLKKFHTIADIIKNCNPCMYFSISEKQKSITLRDEVERGYLLSFKLKDFDEVYWEKMKESIPVLK